MRGSSTLATTLLASIGVGLLCLAPMTAAAAPPQPVAPFEAPPASPEPVMGEYDPDDYEDAAAELPTGLVDALADEGLTGAEYLAQADAAVDAADVIPALDAAVELLGSRLDGTQLIVNVATEAEAAVVAESGAVGEIGPAPEPVFTVSEPEFMQNLEGGEAYYYETSGGSGHRCSIGFNGYSISTGAQRLATAGHCWSGNSNHYHWLEQDRAGSDGYTLWDDAEIGRPVSGSFDLGGGYDFGLVNVDSTQPRAWQPKPEVEYWSGEKFGFKTGAWQWVTDRIPAVVGATMCKSGSTTGWTCGQVLAVDTDVSVEGEVTNSIIATTCLQSGDSGGAGMIGTAAVAIVSWAEMSVPCGHPDYVSGLFPLVSSNPSAESGMTSAPNWEPQINVANAVVNTPVTGSAMTGSLLWGGPRHVIDVYFDGATTPVTVPVVGGQWSVSLASLAPGAHTAQVVGRWGTWSTGPVAQPSFTVAGGEIEGNVKDDQNANLAGVCVDAVAGGVVRASDVTNAIGRYDLESLAAGQYLVHFSDCTQDARTFEDEWWNNADNAAGATAVAVTANQVVGNIDAKLALAGPFADVRNNHAFAPQINWMYSEGLSNGYIDAGVRTYHPVEDVSRQAMAAFLYRYSGSPSFPMPAQPTFTDVPLGHPFYTEIEWMKWAGITNGNVGPGDTLVYLPLDAVSRQAMSAFLYRLAGSPAYEPPASATFTDVPVGSAFFPQVEWMKANALTNGYDDGGSFSFHPVEAVSRQAMAAFLSRYDGID